MIGARIRAGWVDALGSTSQAVLGRDTREGILHPRKRFYAGGAQSVRGYGENQLGPRVLTVDPKKLLDTTRTRPGGPPACTEATIADASCDPNFLQSEEFQPRPTGGSTLVEANVEYRFQLMKHVEGAVFVDGAIVGQGSLETVVEGTGAITPGFGFRYHSPVGPIRVDLGIKPTLAEELFVVTETADHRIVRLTTRKSYDPLEDSRSGIRQVLDRLTLHLSIGQAF